jgi:hypothetical protein
MGEVILKILDFIPKRLKSTIAIMLLIIIIIGLGIYFKIIPNWFNRSIKKEEKCNQLSISGMIIDSKTRQAIDISEIRLEDMTLNPDLLVNEGVFTLKGIRIPKDSIVSLLVKTTNDEIYSTSDIDLSNLVRYPISNCKVDVGVLTITLRIKSQNRVKVEKPNKNASKYSTEIKGNNFGKIIQGDSIKIENVY